MKITLKDGSVKEYSEAKSIIDIAKDISEGLARVACAGEINGEMVDLRTVVDSDCELNIITATDPKALYVIRHTASHVLAEAVKRLFPNAKVTIGPAIDDGFYYDFDSEPFSREDLDNIEAEMKKIIKEGHEITRFTLPRAEAVKYMEEKGEPFKVELIQDLPEDAEISFYDQGGFVDLCAGPHLMSTKGVKAFKLTSSSMAYWRGDSNKARLQRIYGTAYNKKEELAAHLERMEDAKRRDHNRLGREMELFTTVDVIGQGLPLFTPKGTKMIMKLQRWIEDLEDNEWGYMRTRTPLMAKSDLYKISGHWYHYRDKMFVLGEVDDKGESPNGEEIMALRPMTCPFQYQIFKNGLKSYRDLPCRYSETASEFRKEASGEMHGLIRVRQFTLSDGHIICTKEQIEGEFKRCLDLSYYILDALGMREDVTFRFSKRGKSRSDKYIDNDEAWEKTEGMMKVILDDLKIDYVEADDEAAFYGPKLDIQIKNVHGKEDTLITIQIDFAAGESFEMQYIDVDGTKQTPYVIHRSSIGCYERTLAFLIEKYAGAFPLWMCPTQVKILPITDRTLDYAKSIEEKLLLSGIRCEVDKRNEKIGYKIREAKMDKIPYILVVGDKEAEEKSVNVNRRGSEDKESMSFDAFVEKVLKEDREKLIF